MHWKITAGAETEVLSAGQTFPGCSSGNACYQVEGADFSGEVIARLPAMDWQVLDSWDTRKMTRLMRFFPFAPDMEFRFRCSRGSGRLVMGH